jgi:hypothetical protein
VVVQLDQARIDGAVGVERRCAVFEAGRFASGSRLHGRDAVAVDVDGSVLDDRSRGIQRCDGTVEHVLQAIVLVFDKVWRMRCSVRAVLGERNFDAGRRQMVACPLARSAESW